MRRVLTALISSCRRLGALSGLRSLLGALVAGGAGLLFLALVSNIYPAQGWFLTTVVKLWLWQMVLAAAFVAAGDLVIWRLLGLRDTGPLIRLTLAVPVGAVVFAMGMFLGGFLALYGAVFAVAWPVLLVVTAALTYGLRVWPAWVHELRMAAPTTSLLATLAGLFGVVALFVLYLGAFSPDAVNYDAAWSHLVVAQDYARRGRIVPFMANWPAALPHLSSIFYTWAFLVPGLGPSAVRWMMALHTEFAFVIWTLVGVAAAVQLCVHRHVRSAWVVFFLFPGIFVYDNNLGGAADHILAFFAVPALIAAIRGAETLNPRWWAVFGMVAGGGLLTKLQSAYGLFPCAGLLVAGLGRGVWRWTRRRQPPPTVEAKQDDNDDNDGSPNGQWLWRAPLAATACVLIVTAPHFIRNWVFYHNPVYPMAQQIFRSSRPSFSGAALLADNIIAHWGMKPASKFNARILQTLELFWTFSFRPHAGFTGNVPVVGSLFTLSLPLVLVVQRARRVRIAVAIAACAVLAWAYTYLLDRNLQGFLPLLAVATGCLLIRTWELGRLARIGVTVLVSAQLAWSADHFLNGSDRIGSALALIRSGYDGRAQERFKEYRRPYVELGATLPPNARVLLHSIHGSLGIDREVLLDWPGFQGLIDPRDSRTPRELYDRYRALGITHVVYYPGLHPSPVKQDEVVFGALRSIYDAHTMVFGPFHMFELSKNPPPIESPYQVLTMGVPGYQDGVYRVEDLSTFENMPPHLQNHFSPLSPLLPGGVAAQLDQVQALLLGNGALLEPAASAKAAQQFHPLVSYSQFQMQLRR